MAAYSFSFGNFLLRFVFALVVVFATYNPEGYSYFDWAIKPLLEDISDFSVLKALIGILLLVGWIVLVRATFLALGFFGTLLAVVFFALLVWLIIDQLDLSTDSLRVISYVVGFVIAAVLSIGVSWSHLRRKLTGQVDTDDVETT